MASREKPFYLIELLSFSLGMWIEISLTAAKYFRWASGTTQYV